MKCMVIGLLWLIVIVSGGSGTYDVDDAWRQMSGLTDHTATFSVISSKFIGGFLLICQHKLRNIQEQFENELVSID